VPDAFDVSGRDQVKHDDVQRQPERDDDHAGDPHDFGLQNLPHQTRGGTQAKLESMGCPNAIGCRSRATARA